MTYGGTFRTWDEAKTTVNEMSSAYLIDTAYKNIYEKMIADTFYILKITNGKRLIEFIIEYSSNEYVVTEYTYILDGTAPLNQIELGI